MALSESVKVEAMKGSQVPAIYHNNEGGGSTSIDRGNWGRDEGVGQSQLQGWLLARWEWLCDVRATNPVSEVVMCLLCSQHL